MSPIPPPSQRRSDRGSKRRGTVDVPTDDSELAEARIAKEIEEDIIFGRLLPGEQLREETLLERFGASRHAIRCALGRLENLGIVVKERNRSAAVRTFSPAEVREIHEVREILQRQAALRIRLPASAEDIARIAQIEQEYENCLDAGDLRGIHDANDRFHDALFGLCGNRNLQDLIKKMLDMTYAVRSRSLADREDRAQARAEHRLMIDYLAGRDSWALAELCVMHMRSRRDAYLQFLATRETGRPRRRKGVTPPPDAAP
jgi:DNA-binding GntR family transcriptional regulator